MKLRKSLTIHPIGWIVSGGTREEHPNRVNVSNSMPFFRFILFNYFILFFTNLCYLSGGLASSRENHGFAPVFPSSFRHYL